MNEFEKADKIMEGIERRIEKGFKEIYKEFDDVFEYLQKRSTELGEIRATLLVNFGKDAKNNNHTFHIEEQKSTCNMMLEVLNKLLDEVKSEYKKRTTLSDYIEDPIKRKLLLKYIEETAEEREKSGNKQNI